MYSEQRRSSGESRTATTSEPAPEPTTPLEQESQATAPESAQVSQWRARIVELVADTCLYGQTIASRERSYARDAAESRNETGLFGSFHRALTLSDPYELEIRNSSQRAAAAEVAATNLDRELRRRLEVNDLRDLGSLVATMNQCRRVFGMRQIDPRSLTELNEAPVSHGLNRGSHTTEHFDNEQQAITVSRDVAIDSIVAVGTLGLGSGIGVSARGARVVAQTGSRLTLREAATAGARLGAAQGVMSSVPRATEEYNQGNLNLGEAVGVIARDTAVSAALGGVLGGTFQQAARAISHVRGIRARTQLGTRAADEVADSAPAVGPRSPYRDSSPEPSPRPVQAAEDDAYRVYRGYADIESMLEESLTHHARLEHNSRRLLELQQLRVQSVEKIVESLPENSPARVLAEKDLATALGRLERGRIEAERIVEQRAEFLRGSGIREADYQQVIRRIEPEGERLFQLRQQSLERRVESVEEMYSILKEMDEIQKRTRIAPLSEAEGRRLVELERLRQQVVEEVKEMVKDDRQLFGDNLHDVEGFVRRITSRPPTRK